jgi:hypothetical protein
MTERDYRAEYITSVTTDPRWADLAPRLVYIVQDAVTTDQESVFYELYVTGEYAFDPASEGPDLTSRRDLQIEAAADLRWDGETSVDVDGWYAAAEDWLTRLATLASTPTVEARFTNLTPHPVCVYDGDQVVTDIPASGTVARLTEDVRVAEPIGGIRATTVTIGSVTGLPDPQDGVTYIVSMPLLMGMAAAGIDRPDVVYPFGQVRDDQGRIIGCRSLARIAR